MKVEIKFEILKEITMTSIESMINYIGSKVDCHLNGIGYCATIINENNEKTEFSAIDIKQKNDELNEDICEWTTQDIGDNYIGNLIYDIYRFKDDYFRQYQTFTLDEKIRYGQGLYESMENVSEIIKVLYNAKLISDDQNVKQLIEITKMYDDFYSRLLK